ncbi:MAG: hypothetical protein PHU23_03225 [Dehalococcoidales bacterium]|nr:hypothetical protein [Dehalococcoidales bacterium]
MLQAVASLTRKLEEIQGKISDEEFTNKYLGSIARQTWAAYKTGKRNISLDFVSMAWIAFPELHIQIQLALEEIGKDIIARKKKVAKVQSKTN